LTPQDPETFSLRSRFRRGVAWNVVATAFSQGSVFLANVIIARILGREVFGEFSMVQSTLLALTAIAQLATGITATKYVAEFRSTNKERASRVLGLCSVVTAITGIAATVLLLVGKGWLSTEVLKAPQIEPVFAIAAGAVLLSVMSGYQSGALAGFEGFRALAWASAAQGIFHLMLSSVLAWFWGIEGAFTGIVATAAIRWLIFNLALRAVSRAHGIRIEFANIWSERQILLYFALPSAIAGLTTLPSLWLGNAFLARRVDGFSQLAIYGAATSLKTLILILPQLLNTVGTSLLNNQRGLGNADQYRKVFWMNLAATTLSALAGAAVLVVLGKWLLSFFGAKFVEGYDVLLVLILSLLPEAMAVGCYQIIQSQARMWLSFFAVSLPRDSIMVVTAYLLVPSHGAIGLAWAYTISWVIALIVIIALAYRASKELGMSASRTCIQ
jgi:O-antigen/teichoic acid export membrane protein